MDVLKCCATGTHTLGGYASITYHLYSVRTDNLPSDTVTENSDLELLIDVEPALRKRKYLIHVDYARRALWVFDDATQRRLSLGFPDQETAEELRGHTFALLSQGTLRAIELSQFMPRPTIANTSSTGGSSTPSAALRAMQAANLKAFMQTANSASSQDPSSLPASDAKTVYANFVSAVVATVSYHLVKSQNFLPFGTNSLIQRPEKNEKVAVLLLDVYLTTSGTLVLSTSAKAIASFRTLAPGSALYEARAGTQIHLAPSGLAAVIDSAKATGSPEVVETQTTYRSLWKSSVSSWLRRRGIALDAPDDVHGWLQVRPLRPLDQSWCLNEAASTADGTFLWPAELCFLCTSIPCSPNAAGVGPDMLSSLIELTDESCWFRSPDEGGFIDSLHFVQEWLRMKPDREKVSRERKRRQEAEAAQKQTDIQNSATSPLNTRSAIYGDVQASAGVYPTPPDVLITQAGAISDNVPSTGLLGLHSGPVDSQGEHLDPMDIDLALNGKPQLSRSSQSSLPLEQGALNEDLFDYMEEDEVGGNDITDADFSFFDEPDEPETSLLGAESPSPAESKHLLDDGATHAQEAELVRAADLTVDPNIKIEPAEDEADCNELVQPQVLAKDEENAGLLSTQPERESISPLTPSALRQRIFPQQVDLPAISSLRDRRSAFAPFVFNERLTLSDAHYHRSGVFGSPKLTASTKRGRPTSISLPVAAKRSRMLRNGSMKDSSDSDSNESDSDKDSSLESNSLEHTRSPRKYVSYDPNMTETGPNTPVPFAVSPTAQNASDGSIQQLPTRSREKLFGFLASMLDSDCPYPQLLGGPLLGTTSSTVLRGANGPVSPISATSPKSPASTGGSSTSLKLTDKDFIQVAQMAADQVIFSTLDLLGESEEPFSMQSDAEGLQQGIDDCLEKARTTLKLVVTGCTENELLAFATLQDAVPDQSQLGKAHPRPPVRKNTGSGHGDASNPTGLTLPLQPALIRVRRNEGLWDLRPTALPFWEPLGLVPANKSKNVMAYCMYPSNDDLQVQVASFLQNLGAAYEGCRLGSHTRGSKLCSHENGLIPLELTQQYSYEHALQMLRKLCFTMGNQLAKLDLRKRPNPSKSDEMPSIDNFVIYIINPFNEPTALKDICHAFWALYHTYITAPRSPALSKRKLDLVLQVIPIKYVASPGAPVVLEPTVLHNLAREVYNRCPPAGPMDEPSRLRIPSAASIQLEETIPKTIQFKLTSDAPSDMLFENSHMHVGYTVSANREWITAAWTDNSGKYQTTASYCLGRGRNFFEVAREVWQTTIGIISTRKVQWRICIARAGLLEREELDAWMSLATMGSAGPIITTITSVETEPPLLIFRKPSPSSAPAASMSASGNLTSTPVSTPQPGTSPDPNAATPATPSAAEAAAESIANDPDAHLVDITDETWAIILGHRVNVSGDMREYRPSLSSGLMIKTAVDAAPHSPSADGEQFRPTAPQYAAVHLLWVGGSGRGTNNANSNNTGQPPSPVAPSSSGSTPSSSQENGQSLPQQAPPQWTGMLPKATTDNLLREYMQMYRNLGLLARVRGMRGTKYGLLPWHLAAAVRGAHGLECVIR